MGEQPRSASCIEAILTLKSTHIGLLPRYTVVILKLQKHGRLDWSTYMQHHFVRQSAVRVHQNQEQQLRGCVRRCAFVGVCVGGCVGECRLPRRPDIMVTFTANIGVQITCLHTLSEDPLIGVFNQHYKIFKWNTHIN